MARGARRELARRWFARKAAAAKKTEGGGATRAKSTNREEVGDSCRIALQMLRCNIRVMGCYSVTERSQPVFAGCVLCGGVCRRESAGRRPTSTRCRASCRGAA